MLEMDGDREDELVKMTIIFLSFLWYRDKFAFQGIHQCNVIHKFVRYINHYHYNYYPKTGIPTWSLYCSCKVF